MGYSTKADKKVISLNFQLQIQTAVKSNTDIKLEEDTEFNRVEVVELSPGAGLDCCLLDEHLCYSGLTSREDISVQY